MFQMTDGQYKELKAILDGLNTQNEAMAKNVERIRNNEDKLFDKTDDLDHRLTTVETEHNDRKADCQTTVNVTPKETMKSTIWQVILHPTVSIFIMVIGIIIALILLKDMGLRFN